jgi:hypothetical protein
MSEYRVLVTGSRGWANREFIFDVLDACREGVTGGMVVIHGACPSGADAIAARWVADTFRSKATGARVAAEPYPADWGRWRGRAGMIRNQQMVDKGADVCYAFFWNGAANKGTADCAQRAEDAGIFVRRFYL